MSLQKIFHNFLLESGCVPKGSRVLVAVSGGADSVALLHLLCAVAECMDLVLAAAHLDHGLRGDSADDARFVAQVCAGLSVPLLSERQDVGLIARHRKGNLEEVARDVRREFLKKIAADQKYDLIALGHHADDQAETFLMRLLRGAGSTGLSGMSLVNDRFVRPLLRFHHSELVAYLEQNGFSWREDVTNKDLRFTRNRIRHELMPLLESFNPNIASQLTGYCEQLRQEEIFWASLVANEVSVCSVWSGDELHLDRLYLEQMSPALVARVVRQALMDMRGDLRGITSVHVGDIMKLIKKGPVQGELNLPGVWVARRYDKLVLARNKPELPGFFELKIDGEGRYGLPDGRTLILSLENSTSSEHVDAVEFAAEDVAFPLNLRHCRPGDRFKPSGMMAGTKKLQDLFVDLKIPREDRQKALLLLSGEEVLWVVGLRRCEGHRPGPGKKVMRVEIESHVSL